MPLPNPYESPFTIDGQACVLNIARLTVAEAITFKSKFRLFSERSVRMEGLKSQAKTDAEFDEQAARDLALQEEGAIFFSETVAKFVSVKSGLTDEQDAPIRTGEDLLSAYGHREDVLRDVLAAIYLENTLSPQQKKTWRARPASTPGSATTAPAEVPAGATPDATAASALPPAFNSSADAMASSVESPSGPMAP